MLGPAPVSSIKASTNRNGRAPNLLYYDVDTHVVIYLLKK